MDNNNHKNNNNINEIKLLTFLHKKVLKGISLTINNNISNNQKRETFY